MRTRRLELPQPKRSLGPQPNASTNSATCAIKTEVKIKKKLSKRLTLSDLAGARTQDPLLKREMLYQLSYQVGSSFEGANIKRLIYNTNVFS